MPIRKIPGIVLVIKSKKCVFACFFLFGNANLCLFREQLLPMKVALIYRVSMYATVILHVLV